MKNIMTAAVTVGMMLFYMPAFADDGVPQIDCMRFAQHALDVGRLRDQGDDQRTAVAASERMNRGVDGPMSAQYARMAGSYMYSPTARSIDRSTAASILRQKCDEMVKG